MHGATIWVGVGSVDGQAKGAADLLPGAPAEVISALDDEQIGYYDDGEDILIEVFEWEGEITGVGVDAARFEEPGILDLPETTARVDWLYERLQALFSRWGIAPIIGTYILVD